MRITGYEGHAVMTMEPGVESVVVYTGIENGQYRFIKIDINYVADNFAEIIAKGYTSDVINKSNRGYWVRIGDYGTRIYLDELTINKSELFEDIAGLMGGK